MDTLKREFPNARIDFLRKHPRIDVIAAFGSRTCVILSDTLEIIQRHLDTNRDERFYCCEFADILERDVATSMSGNNSILSQNNAMARGVTQADKKTTQDASFNFASLSDDNDVFLGESSPSLEEQLSAADDESDTLNLILMAGESGIIKIVDLQMGRLISYLRGHTGAVRDLKVVKNMLVSCSEDSTIRVWNLLTYECVAVLGGMFGHKDHVLSLDVNYALGCVVSAGTDTTIKQWAVDFTGLKNCCYNLIYKPRQNFANVHRSAITKVAYYGNIILSLCNSTVIAIYNNENLARFNFESIKAAPSPNDSIFIGSINLYDDCKTFALYNHLLIGLGSNGNVYLFDLRGLSKETSPYILASGLKGAEDLVLMNGNIYITTGKAVHCIPLDMERFDEAGAKDD